MIINLLITFRPSTIQAITRLQVVSMSVYLKYVMFPLFSYPPGLCLVPLPIHFEFNCSQWDTDNINEAFSKTNDDFQFTFPLQWNVHGLKGRQVKESESLSPVTCFPLADNVSLRKSSSTSHTLALESWIFTIIRIRIVIN